MWRSETLIDTLADTLEKAEAERLGHTLGDVEMEALIETMADTLLERKGSTLIIAIAAVEAMKLFYILSDMACNGEARSKHLVTWQRTVRHAWFHCRRIDGRQTW